MKKNACSPYFSSSCSVSYNCKRKMSWQTQTADERRKTPCAKARNILLRTVGKTTRSIL